MSAKKQASSIVIFEKAYQILWWETKKWLLSQINAEKIQKEIHNQGIHIPMETITKKGFLPEEIYRKFLLQEGWDLLVTQYIPSVVMLWFCNELALKYLIYLTTKRNLSWHELNKLFSVLLKEDSDYIKINTQKKMNITENEFNDLLLENKKTFVSWRYFHQYKKLHSSFLFLETLFNTIKERIVYHSEK